MITFKQFLSESRSAPLYHTTKVDNLQSIMNDGIKPLTRQSPVKLLKSPIKKTMPFSAYYDETINGVSLSRSIRLAVHWRNTVNGVVLELDQQRLAQRYEIKPVQYWTGYRAARLKEKLYYNNYNEYEEFVITKQPIPPSYIKRIYIGKSYNKDEEKIIDTIRQKYGSEFIRYIS